jgi:hypothetical protein
MKSNIDTRKPFDLWTKYDSDCFTRRLAYFCAQRSGRFSESLCNWIQSGDLKALCSYSIDYRVTDCPRDLAYARQTLAFYSKDADLQLDGVDTLENMRRSFISTEMQCKATNKRLSEHFNLGTLEFHCDSIVFKLRRKIDEILGEAPQLEDLPLSFGPGVNVGVTKDETAPRWKLRAVPTHTESMQTVMETVARDVPHWISLQKGVTQTVVGRLGSVLKNALTDRSIIVEAILNGTYQKGVGSKIKARLLRFGCNLKTQARNQWLARLGSVTEEIVTLDVKNASNTVALLLVFHLFAEKWFNLLDCLRSSQVEVGDKDKSHVITLEMFSSMGNGFTFELESLIFYALALVIAEEIQADTSLISVFGDDIIIPKCMDKRYRECLTFLGFEVNSSKSFSDGPFRESCGCDCFLGVDIRPFYKKDRWTVARVVGLLNHDVLHMDLFQDLRPDLERITWSTYHFGPKGYGDGCVILPDYDPDYKSCIFHIPKQTPKQVLRYGQKDGRYFHYVIKCPRKDFWRYRKMTCEDNALPLYVANLSDGRLPGPNLYNIGKDGKPPRWILVTERSISRYLTDSWVLGSDLQESKRTQVDPKLYAKQVALLDLLATSHIDENLAYDPFVLKGGEDTKTVKVYVLPGYY